MSTVGYGVQQEFKRTATRGSSDPFLLEQKKLLFRNEHSQNLTSKMISAGSAAAFSSGLYNPLDCLRVRWQVQATSRTGKEQLLQYGSQIIREEGLWRGLWRPGLAANMAGMAGAAALRFGFYEQVRDKVVGDGEKQIHHMVIAGVAVGSSAYYLTTPFHLLKTKMQAEAGSSSAVNYISTISSTVREGGIRQLWRGSIPLSCRGALFTSGQMLGYDGVKTLAKSNGYADGPVLHVVASVFASLGASVLSAPADVVMARVMSSSNSASLVTIIRQIYEENPLGFWRGLRINFIRLTPVMLTYSTIYEQLRNHFGIGYLS